ncbi:MAG: SprT family zinc-dependent metalloprotease, partial [bacterium]|nr:SprT family zinc-dependent metalloprotease [bacterium]
RVVVKAPITQSLESVEAKIRKRARWIRRQIKYFNQFDPRTPERLYVSGETHLYLGKKYRLKIQMSSKNSVVLKNGYFTIQAIQNDSDEIKRLIEKWYKSRSKVVFSEIFESCWYAFKSKNITKPRLRIQKMDKRWGSLSPNGQLTLNLSLIRAPKDCIEYVVIHELCHLIEHNHGPEFYKLLDQTMPDWMKRKHKLELSLI